jgi:ubiquinone/menaquinone biosynthesis C-methylase UbiE
MFFCYKTHKKRQAVVMDMDHSPVVKGTKAKWYAEHYYSVEDDIIPIFEKMDTPLLDRKLKPGMNVFDAMMGRGRHAIRYAKRGCRVWGNDFNPHMVAYAKKSAKYLKANLRLSALDATNLKGVPKNQFDATIAMFSALGTVPKSKNRQKAMNEFSRITKPGGIVIVHAHNRLDTFLKPSWWDWVLRTYLKPERGLETGDMITDYNSLKDMFNHFYSPQEFRKSFKKVGLEVIEEHYMHYGKKRFIKGPFRKFQADGFIFVARKPTI